MVKTKPGLPDTFSLNIPPQPATIGDYLDEDPQAEAALMLRRRKAELEVAKTERQRLSEEVSQNSIELPRERVTQNATAPSQETPRIKKTVSKFRQERRARMQMNMGADTEEAFNQLLSYVQKYTLQRDVSSSELFEAMVGALSEAKQHMEFEDVPRRGPWGSPTARAFVNGLERAFARAIANHFNETHKLKRAGNE